MRPRLCQPWRSGEGVSAGQVGIVKPADSVAHRVPGDEPVKALVIWAPGGETERIAQNFNQRPIGGER